VIVEVTSFFFRTTLRFICTTIAVRSNRVYRNKNVDSAGAIRVKRAYMSEPKKSAQSGTHAIATETTTDVAQALGVDESTLRRWIRDREVIPDLVTLGGHARFTKQSVEKLRRKLASG